MLAVVALKNILQKKKYLPKQTKTVVAKVTVIPKQKIMTVAAVNVVILNVPVRQQLMVLPRHLNLF